MTTITDQLLGKKDGRAGRDGDGDGILNEGKTAVIAGGSVAAVGAVAGAREGVKAKVASDRKAFRSKVRDFYGRYGERGGKVVFRGAPDHDPAPTLRGHNAVYVTGQRRLARQYAAAKDGGSSQILTPSGKPGVVSAYAMSRQAKVVDLLGNADARAAASRQLAGAVAAGKAGVGSPAPAGSSYKVAMAAIERHINTEFVQSKLKQAGQWRPSEEMVRTLTSKGIAGTSATEKLGREYALYSAKHLRYLGEAPKIKAASTVARVARAVFMVKSAPIFGEAKMTTITDQLLGKKDGRAGRDGDGDGILNEGTKSSAPKISAAGKIAGVAVGTGAILGGLIAGKKIGPSVGRAIGRTIGGVKMGMALTSVDPSRLKLGDVTSALRRAANTAERGARIGREVGPPVGFVAGTAAAAVGSGAAAMAVENSRAKKGANMTMVLMKAADLRKFDESKIKRDDDGKFDEKMGGGGGGPVSPQKNEKRPGLGRRVLGGLGGAGVGNLIGSAVGAGIGKSPAAMAVGALAGTAGGFAYGMKRTANRESQGKSTVLPTIGATFLAGPLGALAHRSSKDLASRGYGPNAARKVDEGELHKMAGELSAMSDTERTVTLIKLTQAANAPLDAPIPDGLSKKWVDYARQMLSSKAGDDPVEQTMTGGDPAAAAGAAPAPAMFGGMPKVKAKQICSDVAQRAAAAVGEEGAAYRHGYIAGQKRAARWAGGGAPKEEEAPEGEEPEEEPEEEVEPEAAEEEPAAEEEAPAEEEEKK